MVWCSDQREAAWGSKEGRRAHDRPRQGGGGEGLAAGKPTPLVLGLGSDTWGFVKGASEDKLKQLKGWKDVMWSTDFPEGQ